MRSMLHSARDNASGSVVLRKVAPAVYCLLPVVFLGALSHQARQLLLAHYEPIEQLTFVLIGP